MHVSCQLQASWADTVVCSSHWLLGLRALTCLSEAQLQQWADIAATHATFSLSVANTGRSSPVSRHRSLPLTTGRPQAALARCDDLSDALTVLLTPGAERRQCFCETYAERGQ